MLATNIRTISDAQKYILDMYPNSDRDFSYIFGYSTRHVGYLCKSLNKRSPSKEEFVRTVSWLLALANSLQLDIQTAMIARHPDICPYCVAKPCACWRTNKEPAIRIQAYKVPQELSERAAIVERSSEASFDVHAARLAEIYPGNYFVWKAIGAWQVSAKMSEELAEVHEAATKYFSNRKELVAVGEEFADLMAWLLSAWHICFPEKSLHDSFIEYYIRGCPVCGRKDSCVCTKFSEISAELVEVERIREVERAFNSLVEAVGVAGDEIEDIRRSLKAAASTQSEPVARSALLQTKKKAEELEKLADRSGKNIKNAGIIAGTIYKILESIPYLGLGG